MAAKPGLDQINYLNIGLMLLSAGLAFAYPFELFLLAYAVLGPLHYLTEISWLHDKNYYTKGRADFLFLGSAAVGITALYLGLDRFVPRGTGDVLAYLAFASALVFLLVEGLFRRILFLLIAVLFGWGLASFPFFGPLFGLLLPTLIHVFVFTGLFILAGALRGRSLSGLVSLAVFLALACGFLFVHPSHAHYQANLYVRDNYGILRDDGTGSSVFISLNLFLSGMFGLAHFGPPTQPFSAYFQMINDFLYKDPAALALMSFIAFAYTYHYFNWFSKTSIIRWHEVPRARALAVLGLWVASLILYAMNYSLGFKWLFFLSFAHVVLEFPLNHLTLIQIGKEGGRVVSGEWKGIGG